MGNAQIRRWQKLEDTTDCAVPQKQHVVINGDKGAMKKVPLEPGVKKIGAALVPPTRV